MGKVWWILMKILLIEISQISINESKIRNTTENKRRKILDEEIEIVNYKLKHENTKTILKKEEKAKKVKFNLEIPTEILNVIENAIKLENTSKIQRAESTLLADNNDIFDDYSTDFNVNLSSISNFLNFEDKTFIFNEKVVNFTKLQKAEAFFQLLSSINTNQIKVEQEKPFSKIIC